MSIFLHVALITLPLVLEKLQESSGKTRRDCSLVTCNGGMCIGLCVCARVPHRNWTLIFPRGMYVYTYIYMHVCLCIRSIAKVGWRCLSSQGFQGRVLLQILFLFNLHLFSLIQLLHCHLNTKMERGSNFLPVSYHVEAVPCRLFQEQIKYYTEHETKTL